MPFHDTRTGTRLSTFRPVLDRLILALALLGVLTSVHLHIQQSRGFDQGCFGFSAPSRVEATFDCGVVTSSEASTLFGVSNSVWGLLFYLTVGLLSAAAVFSAGTRMNKLKQGRALVIAAGFAYSLYLVYYQFFSIGELCALCLMSAGITTLLFIVQGLELVRRPHESPASEEERPVKTRREAVLIGSMALVVALLVGADVVYFRSIEAQADPLEAPDATARVVTDDDMPSAVSDECHFDPDRPRVENHQELVNFFDPVKGSSAAPVTVIEYFDPNCPHCRTIHPIMNQVQSTHGDKARFVYKPFVIWEHSLLQSQALYAAAQEGKFFDMLEMQFAMQRPQTGLSEEELRDIALQIGMDPDDMMRKVESGVYERPLAQEKQQGAGIGVRGVPALLINGRFVAGTSRTADCLRELIDASAAHEG